MHNELPLVPAADRQIVEHLKLLDRQVEEIEAQIRAWHRGCEPAEAGEVPGIGPLTATALVASVGDAKNFENGRQMAAWLGLVPGSTPVVASRTARHEQARRCVPANDADPRRALGDLATQRMRRAPDMVVEVLTGATGTSLPWRWPTRPPGRLGAACPRSRVRTDSSSAAAQRSRQRSEGTRRSI